MGTPDLLSVFIEDSRVLIRSSGDDLAGVLLVDVEGQDTRDGGTVQALASQSRLVRTRKRKHYH